VIARIRGDGFVEWPDSQERDGPANDPSLVAWYYDPRHHVSVEVHAAPARACNDGGRDPVAWARDLERRYAPEVIQQAYEGSDGVGFRVWIDDRGQRSATMRALQATWHMPDGDDLADVIHGFAERDSVLYRVTVAMPAGWAWWDLPPPPDRLPPRAVLDRARSLYRTFIGPIEGRPVAPESQGSHR
jgi:hypothetical protein